MKGSRTFYFNIAAAIIPVLEIADFTNLFGETGMAVYGVLMTIANVILRAVTTTPIFQKR